MTKITKVLKEAKISYDGYEYEFILPSKFNGEVFAEWKKENKKEIKQLKAELKAEYEKSID